MQSDRSGVVDAAVKSHEKKREFKRCKTVATHETPFLLEVESNRVLKGVIHNVRTVSVARVLCRTETQDQVRDLQHEGTHTLPVSVAYRLRRVKQLI
jgi:hypothetical protein